MGNIVKTIKQIGLFTKESPVSDADVLCAETELGVKFADDYREYVMHYGAIRICGLELTGITSKEHNDVVSVTEYEKTYNKNISSGMYVIERMGVDSIVILQDSSGNIYINSPRHETKKIFDSLSEYLIQASSEFKKD